MKRMYDGGKIITGLIIGVGLLLSPFIYNAGRAAKAPVPELTEKAKEAKECVASTPYMKAWHMQLLDGWRNTVVRDGDRYYKSNQKTWDMGLLERWRHIVVGEGEEYYKTSSGKVFYKSLQVTCMDCHSNKSKFCDQCHNYMGVTPYCWDCHIAPKENK
jgi:hypothetical protein